MSDDYETAGLDDEALIAGLDDDTIGAIARTAKFNPAMLRTTLARRLSGTMPRGAARPAARSSGGMQDADNVPLPVNSNAVIAAGASLVITTTPQIFFKPRRLVVPPSISTFFTIDEITVGNVPLFASQGSMSAECFHPDSFGANLRKVTAGPGIGVIVRVTNIDAAGHQFRAGIFGEGADAPR